MRDLEARVRPAFAERGRWSCLRIGGGDDGVPCGSAPEWLLCLLSQRFGIKVIARLVNNAARAPSTNGTDCGSTEMSSVDNSNIIVIIFPPIFPFHWKHSNSSSCPCQMETFSGIYPLLICCACLLLDFLSLLVLERCMLSNAITRIECRLLCKGIPLSDASAFTSTLFCSTH